MTDQATAPAAATPEPVSSDITIPQTVDAQPDAGKTEEGAPTAEAADKAEPTPEKAKEPTQADINRRERNQRRWADMKAKADRAEAAEAELAKLKGIQDPDWSKYADPNEEVADRVFHKLRKEQIPVLEQQAKTSRKAAAAIEAQAFEEAMSEAAGRIPDFDAVVRNPNVSFAPQMVPYVANSDKGADVAYYLGKNPDVARQLAETFAQNPAAGFIELGRIEGKVSAPTAKPASTAPKPAPIISGGSNPPAFDAERASTDDMAARLKAAGIIR